MASLLELTKKLVVSEGTGQKTIPSTAQSLPTQPDREQISRMVANMHAASMPSLASAVSSEPKISLKDAKDAIVKAETPVTIPTEPEVIKPVDLPVAPEVEAPAKIIEKETPEIIDHSKLNDREYVNKFLGEVNDVILSGQALEKLYTDKKERGTISDAESQRLKILLEQRRSVGSVIADLFGEGAEKVSGPKLAAAQKAYNEYLDAFTSEVTQEEKASATEITKINLEINAKVAQLKKGVAAIGGEQNFQKIKNVIQTLEKIGATARKEYPLQEETKKQIAEKVVAFVSEDLHGAQLLIGEGDIVALLIRIYSDKN